jgi:hypothetical protein
MTSITELVDVDYATDALIRLLAIDSVTGHEAAIGAALVDELQKAGVPASAIPEVKQACRSVSVADCRLIAEKALAMDGAREVKAYLRDQLRRLLAQTVA